MKSVFLFFAKQSMFAKLFTILIVVVGVSSLFTIKKDLYPTVELDEIYIETFYYGASPKDIELNITNKVENVLKQIDGIKDYTSISSENVSTVIVKLDPELSKAQRNVAEQRIRNGITRISDFPKDIDKSPVITKVRASDIPVIEVGFSVPNMEYRVLRAHANRIAKKIKNVSGVAKIKKYGYRKREVRVEILPDKLEEYALPMHEIISAIRRRNIRQTNGVIMSSTTDHDIVTLAQFEKPQDVGEVVVRTSFNGPAVYVKDVAQVVDDFEEEKMFSRINGKKVITFTVFKKESADIIRTVNSVKAFFEKEKEVLPENACIVYAGDQSRYVKASYKIVKNNAILGFVLVFIMLSFFLGWRTSLWVALGIPMSLFGTIAILPCFGVSLDIITLTAMVLVIGIIVDDAIVVAEAIESNFEKGLSPIEAVVQGVSSVFLPVLTTVLTTFLAFIPLFFISGEIGKFIYVMPLVVIISLSISLVESSIVLPSHIMHGLHRKSIKGFFQRWFSLIEKWYVEFLRWALFYKYIFVGLFFLLFGLSMLLAFFRMETIIFPDKASEEFYIYVRLPVGTPLDVTSSKVKEIEDILARFSDTEISSYVSFLGRGGEFGDCNQKYYAIIMVDLVPFSLRERMADEIVADVRAKTNLLTGFEKITYDVNEVGPSSGKAIEIRVVGDNALNRMRFVNDLELFLNNVEGICDIKRDDTGGKNTVEIKLNYDLIARLGLTVNDIAKTVNIAFDGEEATKVQYGEDETTFRVVYPKKMRNNIKFLNNLSVCNSDNRLVPLSDVAQFKKTLSVSGIAHYNGERVVTVSANVDNSKIAVDDVINEISSHFKIEKDYVGVRFFVEGLAKTQKDMKSSTLKAFLFALMGIYILLALLFNSFTQPFLIMIAIPFGISGVIFALFLHNEPISFMAIVGSIGLAGVVINDSIVLVNHLNLSLKNGHMQNFNEIILAGSKSRLRAVLLTTMTTVSGVLPLAYGVGGYDPINASMALALGWGLLFATPLTLVLIPCLYVIMHRVSFKINNIFKFVKRKVKRT